MSEYEKAISKLLTLFGKPRNTGSDWNKPDVEYLQELFDVHLKPLFDKMEALILKQHDKIKTRDLLAAVMMSDTFRDELEGRIKELENEDTYKAFPINKNKHVTSIDGPWTSGRLDKL